MALTRDELAARLLRAGKLEVSGGDQAEIDSYLTQRPCMSVVGEYTLCPIAAYREHQIQIIL
jgi:hypothetical protein